jgi:ribosomal protein L11 methyltransferase
VVGQGFVKRKSLWRISVTTAPEAEEAVMELLGGIFSQPASSFTDAETKRSTVSVYCPQKPANLRRAPGELRAGLANIRKCGLNPAPGRISFTKIRRESWAHSWKRHFRPLEIGSFLLIKPSWNRRRPRKGQGMVVLDPGLSFGTGQHPTTAFCLRQLVVRRQRGAAQSLLDMGTGSAILAISAVKLGYSPVAAFDFDPEAVRVARANARQNGVLRQIYITHRDLTRLSRQRVKKYDVVCANLISNLLIAERERIISRLKPGGALVLAGILRMEFLQVQRAYENLGLKLVASRAEKEWRSGAFVFTGAS